MELTDRHRYIYESIKKSQKYIGFCENSEYYKYVKDLYNLGYLKPIFSKIITHKYNNVEFVYFVPTEIKLPPVKNKLKNINELFTHDDFSIKVKNLNHRNIFTLKKYPSKIYINDNEIDVFAKFPSSRELFFRYCGKWYSTNYVCSVYHNVANFLNGDGIMLYTNTKLKRTRLEKLKQIIDI